MRKSIMPLLASVIPLGLVISLATPGLAQKYRSLYSGLDATVDWYLYDEDTGVYTDISVYATDGINKNPPSRSEQLHFLNIWISQYSYDADGNWVPIKQYYFWGDILPQNISIRRSLSGASLTAYGLEGWQWDYATELETAIIFDVEIGWNSIGPPNNHHYGDHYRLPDGYYYIHSTGKSREASVVGGVVYDGTVATFGGTSGYGSGYIISTKDGTIGTW